MYREHTHTHILIYDVYLKQYVYDIVEHVQILVDE